MGRAKELQMEIEEAWAKGYLPPARDEKYVCASHFRNKYLRLYIIQNGHQGICSYCNKPGVVIDLADLIDYVGGRITSFVGPIDDENLYLASSFYDDDDEEIPGCVRRGQYIAPEEADYYEDVYELIADFDLLTNNHKLDNDITACFHVDQWIRKDPMMPLMKDDLLMNWHKFSELVKTKMRYTFFRSDEYYKGASIPELETDIIDEVSRLVKTLEQVIPSGKTLFRGRPEDGNAN